MAPWQCRQAECAWHGSWYQCPWDGFDLCCPRCGGICDPVVEDSESAAACDRACVLWSGVLLLLTLGLAALERLWGERPVDLTTVLLGFGGVVGWIGWGLFVYRKEKKGARIQERQ